MQSGRIIGALTFAPRPPPGMIEAPEPAAGACLRRRQIDAIERAAYSRSGTTCSSTFLARAESHALPLLSRPADGRKLADELICIKLHVRVCSRNCGGRPGSYDASSRIAIVPEHFLVA